MFKICSKCKFKKHHSKFHKDNQKKDGFRSSCINCNIELKRQYNKFIYSDPERRAKKMSYCKEYEKTHRMQRNIWYRKWRKKNPDRVRAHRIKSYQKYRSNPENEIKLRSRSILRSHVYRGKIVPPKNCSGCGENVKLHGHHENYSKPLDVIWLCKKCHIDLHTYKNRMNDPKTNKILGRSLITPVRYK